MSKEIKNMHMKTRRSLVLSCLVFLFLFRFSSFQRSVRAGVKCVQVMMMLCLKLILDKKDKGDVW